MKIIRIILIHLILPLFIGSCAAQKPNNEREYYQVAYTVNDEKTFNREVSAFKNIKDNYPKYLLTLDFDNTSIDGIRKLNVIDWLLE